MQQFLRGFRKVLIYFVFIFLASAIFTLLKPGGILTIVIYGLIGIFIPRHLNRAIDRRQPTDEEQPEDSADSPAPVVQAAPVQAKPAPPVPSAPAKPDPALAESAKELLTTLRESYYSGKITEAQLDEGLNQVWEMENQAGMSAFEQPKRRHHPRTIRLRSAVCVLAVLICAFAVFYVGSLANQKTRYEAELYELQASLEQVQAIAETETQKASALESELENAQAALLESETALILAAESAENKESTDVQVESPSATASDEVLPDYEEFMNFAIEGGDDAVAAADEIIINEVTDSNTLFEWELAKMMWDLTKRVIDHDISNYDTQ